jgi:ElaB/YqjD/DUF883 family membrane-anchored ribosome-binding protein
MSSVNPGTPSGTPFEHVGNGSLGAGGTGTSAGPSGPGTFPGPATHRGGRGWTRSHTSQRSEFGAFLDDLSDLARGTGGGVQAELRGEIERRVSQARDQMNQAIDQGVEMSHHARERMQRGIDYSRDTVSERPLASLMVAAVGGLIVGLLMSRRD